MHSHISLVTVRLEAGTKYWGEGGMKLVCSQSRAEVLLHSPNKYLLSLAVCINMEM